MTSIILADDHELIREAVKPYLFQISKNVSIIEASTYDEVVAAGKRALAAGEPVPLALIDLHMPGSRDGDLFAGLRMVCEALPGTAVVIFSASEDGQTIAAALKSGARGYVPKTSRGRSLVTALKLVVAGEIYVPPSMVADVFADRPPTEPREPSAGGIPSSPLSPREAESLRLLTEGKTNKEIARELGLQDVTVKMHLRNAYRKIGATNRIEAVRIAIEQNL